MEEKIKERLPQLWLATLHQLDHGRLERQFRRCIASAINNISDFPVRGGKPEAREVNLKLILTPVIRRTKKPIENGYGVSEVEVPEIVGLTVRAVVKDKLPSYETCDVMMATEINNDRIRDVRFNPTNSVNPLQLEIDFDDAPDSGSDGLDDVDHDSEQD